MIKLSIITVTYNAEQVIENCLKSIVAQKTSEVEYLVVDGLSKDKTVQIVNEYRSSIDQFVSEKDTGIYDAMNKGWRMAKGEYILFINADDSLNPDAAQAILKTISSHPSLDILFFPVNILSQDGNLLGQFIPKIDRPDHSYYSVPACHQGIVMKRSLFEQFKGFDQTFRTIADFDLIISSLKKQATFEVFEFPISSFSIGGQSANPIKYEGELRKLYKKHNYYDFRSEIFLSYVRMSLFLQKALPKQLVKSIKRIKKSKFSDFEV